VSDRGDSDSPEIGRRYDEWLDSWTPVSLYVRWYLLYRWPSEYMRLLDALGPSVPRLLDVGCAAGLPLSFAHRRGLGLGVLAGIDVSGRVLTIARGRLDQLAGSGMQVILERASSGALPFADASFDAVTCNGLVKYLDDVALLRTLCEMRRVCVSGGRVAIGEFGPRVTRLFARIWRVSAIEDHELRSAAALERAIEDAGFEAVNRLDIPRMRRFPYEYVGLVATAP
jgi:SAM-dependent methyltransferase